MKYDWTKCNNLDWQYKDKCGYCRVSKDKSRIAFIHNDKTTSYGCEEAEHCMSAFSLKSKEIPDWIDSIDIIPRNPETYNAWKVEDRVTNTRLKLSGKVVARIEDCIGVRWDDSGVIEWILINDINREDVRLICTEYEEEIRAGLPVQKRFKEGEVVVCREKECWFAAYYVKDGLVDDIVYRTYCGVKECLPLNDRTWKLIGTIRDYKEDGE